MDKVKQNNTTKSKYKLAKKYTRFVNSTKFIHPKKINALLCGNDCPTAPRNLS